MKNPKGTLMLMFLDVKCVSLKKNLLNQSDLSIYETKLLSLLYIQ
jgi:hypothetical protein